MKRKDLPPKLEQMLGDLPDDMPPFLKEFIETAEIDPNWDELQGKESAEEPLRKNRIEDSGTADAVLDSCFGFSEFQELNLYHKSGFFENEVDYKDIMTLMPMQLSPLFGKIMAEFAFAAYLGTSHWEVKPITLLSLGAGRGYLDHDLIRQATHPNFNFDKYLDHVIEFRDNSKFILSDRTDNSIELLRSELSELIDDPSLDGRIDIRKIDAMDFDLENLPYGIIYSNELIDNMPTEPIVLMGSDLYCIKLLAYEPSQENEVSEKIKKISDKIEVKGAISKEYALSKIESGNYKGMKFMPVFIPLHYDSELDEEAKQLPTLKNITTEDFGGIYPIHVGLDKMFNSIYRSFDHAAIMLIDYVSKGHGQHNWNKAVNSFNFLEFGKEDIDFQIDQEQVFYQASRSGIGPIHDMCINLGQGLETGLDLIHTFDESDFRKAAKIHDVPYDNNFHHKLALLYAFSIRMAEEYKVMSMKFIKD